MAVHAEHLTGAGLCRRAAERIILQRDLLDTLHQRERNAAGTTLSAETGLPHLTVAAGEHVASSYHQAVPLTSCRSAMIDNGLGFQLVRWSPSF